MDDDEEVILGGGHGDGFVRGGLDPALHLANQAAEVVVDGVYEALEGDSGFGAELGSGGQEDQSGEEGGDEGCGFHRVLASPRLSRGIFYWTFKKTSGLQTKAHRLWRGSRRLGIRE